MTATVHYLPPGHAPARRAMQDAKTPAWIKEIAASMTGDTAPEDLIMAEPGTTPRVIIPVHVPVLDYAPQHAAPFRSWRADFFDGVAGAVLFAALGAVGGIFATVLVMLRWLA